MNQFKKKRCKEQTYRRRGEKCRKKYVLILSVFFFSLVESWWNRRRRKWLEFYEYLICIYSDCKLFEIMNFNNKFSYTLLFSFFLSFFSVCILLLFVSPPDFRDCCFIFFIFFLVASFWCKFLSPFG